MRKFIPELLIVASLVIAPHLRGQDPDPPEPVDPGWLNGGEDEETPDSQPAKPAADASTPDFKLALDMQARGKWKAAQKLFRQMLDKYPESIHKSSAEVHSDDNALLGCETIHKSGPPERRIDVTVMGDGFTLDDPDQQLEEDWAKLCLKVLWSEFVYDEYKDYFNYYFVRLASLEEGVDPALSPEQKAKIEERNKSKVRKKKTEFSTALDCKEAGPQGQVLADRNLVYKWLKIAGRDTPGCQDDSLVIAFARFGKLGMGGGGIANVGRPDKSVTVHEFGHAFVGLLDEYCNNPGKPYEGLSAPNASLTSDRDKVPWAHFLKKKVPGVDVIEGGATYFKGVWRPCRDCAMNSAGHMNYCAVCREAGILKVYSYVNPIDSFDPPNTQQVEVTAGAQKFLSVTPMRPKSKALEVTWWVESIDAALAMPEAEARTTGAVKRNRIRDSLFGLASSGIRGSVDRKDYDQPPAGVKSALGTSRKAKDGTIENVLCTAQLKPGRYRITAAVADKTPSVLYDPKHLLEERKMWWVKVVAAGAAAK